LFFNIRDPVWNNIRLDPFTRRLVDTPDFQRLRYVRQLGLAYLVYPGATHSRFEHALGTYSLARRALALLDERGDLAALPAEECRIVRAAAILHDIGHYPFSHALEEIGVLHHEQVARPLLTRGPIAEALVGELGPDAPSRVLALITGESESPLAGLISGSLDLDKIEYLKRDAFMCGVPYGEIDVDRLLNTLLLVFDTASARPIVGVMEKGLSALESLLFAKYQMYRNVYWHHAVRSATAMYKRLVGDALTLLGALRERRLYKRAFECPAAELEDGVGEWIAEDHPLTVAVEDALAREWGLAPGELLLDYPEKTQMLGLDIPVLRRSGEVRRLTAAGWEGAINLPRVSEELYRSARWLRVFVARRVRIPRGEILALLHRPAADVRDQLAGGKALS
jgi:hypothetical protein